MTFLVESVRRDIGHTLPLVWDQNSPGRARRANYPLSLQRYCDEPSGGKVILLVKIERGKIVLSSVVKCSASIYFNDLQWLFVSHLNM